MPRPRKKDPLQEQMLAFLPYLDVKSIANVLVQSPDIDAFLPSTEQETQYPADPVKFMTQTLGYAMWPKLAEICRSVERNKNTVVASGFGCGKCPEENESIFLANGSVVAAKDLVGKHFTILGFDPKDWQTRPMEAWAESNGLQDVYEVALDDGRKIVRTGNHPLLTWNGWRSIEDLEVGDRVAIPLEHNVEGKHDSATDDDIKLLAYLLTEGYTKSKNQVTFAQSEGPVLDEFMGVADRMGCRVVKVGKYEYGLRSYHLRGDGAISKGGVNIAINFCREHGLYRKGSSEKAVPPWVFMLPRKRIALFLNRMYACDGCVHVSTGKDGHYHGYIAYHSTSYRLANDILLLLMRFGIYAQLAFSDRKDKRNPHIEWRVVVGHSEDITQFLSCIDSPLGKEKQSEDLKAVAKDRLTSDYRKPRLCDRLPLSAWKEVKSVYVKREPVFKAQKGNYPSRYAVRQHNKFTGHNLFSGWADSKIGWIDIDSITHLGKRQTVAISVPETNAYATTVIDHNSITAASVACWYMTVFKPAIVIVLAPSFNQVQNVLFRYIRSAGRAAKLPGEIYDSPRWEVAPDHYAIGLSPRRSSAEDAATIQGFHGPKVLVILDEAAGLPGIIWDTVSGLAVGQDCRVLALANPIEQGGPFWAACNSQSWHHIRISCFEHPNVVEGREVIPGAVTRGWIEERITDGWATEVEAGTPEAVELPWLQRWFLPTPIFMAKVQGIAPPQAEDQLIHLAWVVEAQNRVIEDRHAEVVLGLDPAPRSGDDNALCTRYGQSVRSIKRLKGQDTQVMAEWLAMTIRETGAIKAYIEDMGSGAGCTDKARAMGLPVIAVNTSRSARQKKRFSNLRAECWWTVRELLREGKMSLPANDHLLAGDLVAPKYEPDGYGRILIENKDAIRARLGRSPDSGDALAITYAQPVVEIDDAIMAGARELAQAESGGTNSRWVVEGRRRVSRWRR